MASPTLYLDKRHTTNGRASHIKMDNFVALHTFIANYLAANPTLITGVVTLSDVLTNGNTTSNGQTIESLNGDSFIDLRYGGVDNTLVIANEPTLAKGILSMDNTTAQLSFNSAFYTEVTATVSRLAGTGSYSYIHTSNLGNQALASYSAIAGAIVVDNTDDRTQEVTGTGVLLNSGNTNVSTMLTGVEGSVIVGGDGLTAKTDNTAYVNQISLQPSTVLFDGILKPATITADQEWTLPNTTGTVVVQRTASAGATTAVDGQVLFITAGGAPVVVDLPVATVNNQRITVKKVDAGVGTVVVTPNGAETIDGAASYTLTNQYDHVTIVSNGTEWFVIGNN